jgi:hypothetical protein
MVVDRSKRQLITISGLNDLDYVENMLFDLRTL